MMGNLKFSGGAFPIPSVYLLCSVFLLSLPMQFPIRAQDKTAQEILEGVKLEFYSVCFLGSDGIPPEVEQCQEVLPVLIMSTWTIDNERWTNMYDEDFERRND